MSAAKPITRAPRVLVTRAPHQASALADALRALGAEPVLVATIEIVPPESFAALDAAVAQIGEWDWVVFTSANAVEAFADRLALQVGPSARERFAGKVAAVGAATARALRDARFRVDVVPPVATAAALGETLAPLVRGARCLLVLGEAAGDGLAAALRAAGAQVRVAVAYRTVVAAGAAQRLREVFAAEDGGPDAVAFTSGSAVQHFYRLLQTAGLELSKRVVRASIGPVTSAALAACGASADVEAAEASVEALAAAVMDLLWR